LAEPQEAQEQFHPAPHRFHGGCPCAAGTVVRGAWLVLTPAQPRAGASSRATSKAPGGETTSRAFTGDGYDTCMARCAPCFRLNAAHGVSANLARPTKWSPRATQRQHPGTYETGGRLWDQIELARHRAGCVWRGFLGGRSCHLNLKPTSLTRLWRKGGDYAAARRPIPRVATDPSSGSRRRLDRARPFWKSHGEQRSQERTAACIDLWRCSFSLALG